MTDTDSGATMPATETLEWPLDASLYDRIRKEGLFHFQDGLFLGPLPDALKSSGNIRLIRDRRPDRSGENPFSHPEDWHILSLHIDGADFPSFIALRRDGSLTGSLQQALVEFAMRRATGEQALPGEMASRLRKLLTDLVGLDPTPSDQDQVGDILREFLKDGLTRSPATLVESFLAARGIPVQRQADAFYFSAREGEFTWDARFVLDADADNLTLISTARLDSASGKESECLSDVNALNARVRFGFFRLLPNRPPELEFVSSMPLSTAACFPEKLSDMLNRNMDAMHAACTAFRMKHTA